MSEFIAHDWCGAFENMGRYTHIPSGKTLVCQPHMDQWKWDQKQIEYFKQFSPDLVVHKNRHNGAYYETGDTYGTVGEIIKRLEDRYNYNIAL